MFKIQNSIKDAQNRLQIIRKDILKSPFYKQILCLTYPKRVEGEFNSPEEDLKNTWGNAFSRASEFKVYR